MDATHFVRGLNTAKLDGEVVTAGHAAYDKLRRVWNAMADRRPAAIVQAKSIADIGRVVSVAAESGVLLAVRGGGHSIPGFSTCDGGVVLDLSLLNAVTLDAAGDSVEAQGGALLGDLDRVCVAQGRVVPAGVISHTGIGGLTLGGGMGWLSRRLGLTIDSLVAADIITADGQSRRVSADMEPDLFWAIRGGGGNFGVVTRFIFRTHALGQTLVGTWIYSASDTVSILRRYREAAAQTPRDVTTAVFISATELRITALWSGSDPHADQKLAPFGKFGKLLSESLGDMSFLALQSYLDEPMAWDRRYYSRGGYFEQVDDRAIDCIIANLQRAPSPLLDIYLLQLGGAISDIGEEATPYTGRTAGHYWIVGAGWDSAADDQAFMGWCRQSAGRMADISMRGNYVNEQGDFEKDVALNSYGDSKFKRLASLKARYDPTNMFRLNQNIEPKF